MNMNRGDTFWVRDDLHRGVKYTCVGTYPNGTVDERDDGYFYAGDTNGNMCKFSKIDSETYEVHSLYTNKVGRGIISAEAIISD